MQLKIDQILTKVGFCTFLAFFTSDKPPSNERIYQ